jgi:hypothetical protein
VLFSLVFSHTKPLPAVAASVFLFEDTCYVTEPFGWLLLQQAAKPFFLLAGPNVIESEEHALKMAKHIKGITTR